ncbi:MAG: hypothetical protein HS110_01120 [Zoogloeaceae bacterium]|nr:hypothetical protein [Zoogloeaceae bacterium]
MTQSLELDVLARPPTPASHSSQPKWSLLIFFALLFTKPALLGPATEIAGFGLVIKLIDLAFVLYVITYVVLYADYFLKQAIWLIVTILFFCSSFFLSELLNEKKLIFSIYESLKFSTPLLGFLVLYREAKHEPDSVARYCYAILVAMFALAIAGVGFLPERYKSGVAFAPAYFGGLHTSAYVISLSTICFYFLARANYISHRQLYFWLLIGIALLFVAWQVRTALVLFVTFFLLISWKSSSSARLWMVVLFYTGTLTGIVLLLFQVLHLPSLDQLTMFSSGRLAMWQFKLELLSKATLLQMLFGRGIGSDLTLTDIWWWAAKDSHNDFLHLLTELGIVGLGLAIILFAAYRKTLAIADFAATALFVGFAAASILSNGLMFRPTPALFFSMALALSTIRKKPNHSPHPQ